MDDDVRFTGFPSFVFTAQGPSFPAIIGFTLLSSTGGSPVSEDDLGFTADSVSVNFDGLWSKNGEFVAQILFAPIPLPATLPLLAAGLAALALARRRRMFPA